ncbi:MAG: hypothetical protein NT154_22155, partial [Verrucomicrobia bacterium]|nr:hypothetical protein [Verrucomicrobiota bacterium]
MNTTTNSRKWSWIQLNEHRGARMAMLLLTLAMTTTHLPAQVFTTLHTFTGGSDGANPFAGLSLSGNTLYGTTIFGGSSGYGTLFSINTNGTGYKVLQTFNGGNNEAYPETTLLLSGNTLYGASGGPGLSSTLFAINTNGTGFTTRYTFTPILGPALTNRDGANTFGTMVLSGNTLYAAACFGGSGGSGTVYAVNTNGTGFKTLYTFTATSPPRDGVTHNPPYTNSDGVGPIDGVILSGNTLYGMTEYGGSSGWGTVYAINTNGTGFTTLHSFTGGTDGGWPLVGPLTLSGNTLYGTTIRGGSGAGNSGNGTVFALNTDGTGFKTLHIFTATNALHINSDGASPSGGVILSGNTLYGTTQFGGNSGNGTVYAVNTDGTGFTTLHSFAAQPNLSTAVIPSGGVILSGNTLYGTTHSLGISGKGTLFSLSFRPQLTAIPSETNLIISWPTNYAGFDYTGYTLQSTTNLGSSAFWTTNSSAPVVV